VVLYEAKEGGILNIILQIEMVLGQAAELHVELVDVVVHELEEVGAA
jgi:hypothetical protein